MNKYYFAKDGNFGSSEGILIVDASNWTEDEWDRIEEAADGKWLVAAELSNDRLLQLSANSMVEVLSSGKFYDFFNGEFQKYMNGDEGTSHSDLVAKVKAIFER